MKTALISSFYAANVQYFCKLLQFEKVCIDGYQHYTKQTFRNRCQIASANGKMDLIIPVIKTNGNKTLDKDIRIANEPWQKLHWGALEAAYRHSPFFMYYEDDLAPLYHQKFDFLLDFNTQLQAVLCELIGFQPNLEMTSAYQAPCNLDEASIFSTADSCVADFRECISPKKQTVDTHFNAVPYYQVFADKFQFLPNLSIFDLLFNMGNESLLILKKCIL